VTPEPPRRATADTPQATPRRRRVPTRPLIAVLAALTAAAGIGLPVIKAVAATTVITINSPSFGGPDTAPGDGVCESAFGPGVCTLRAALEELNAATRTPGQVLINVDTSIMLNTAMSGTCNTTGTGATNMVTTSINRQDSEGAQFVVSQPVTIDLGHRLRPYCIASDTNTETAMFYVTASNVTFQNADNVLSTGSSFVIGGTSSNVTLIGDTVGYNGGYGRIDATPTWYPERFAVIMQGASNITVTKYQISGYYSSNTDGGMFVFSNPVASAPSRITANVLVDDVQVLQNPTGSSCSSSNGINCAPPVIQFWAGSNGASYQYNVISGLTFQNMLVQGMGSSAASYGFHFVSTASSAGTNSADITDLTITNNRFLNNYVPGGTAQDAWISLPYPGYLHGTNVITNNIFTSPDATGSQTGRRTALFLLGAESAGSTRIYPMTIANNYFNGYGDYGTIRVRQAGLVTITGNTFGRGSIAYANGSEETSDANVQLSLAPTFATPYLASNQNILPWYPSSANASVPSGAMPVGVKPFTTVADNGLPTCPAVVTVTKPTAGSTHNSVPADPVTLDVYWTGAQTSEVYLGQVTNLSGPSATLAVPLPVGTVTLPDGQTVTPVNPSSGATTGYIRMQTQVQGLGQLESSQYSRVVPVVGTCSAALTLNQASGMSDPTVGRDLHFTLVSTTPLDPNTVTPSVFSVSASAVPQTINASLLNARIVAVTPVGSDGLTFDVVARVDDSCTVTVSVGANKVATTSGFTNPSASTGTDNAITFLNPLQLSPPSFTLITGEPKGRHFTIGLAPGAAPPTDNLQFSASIDQPGGTPVVSLSDAYPVMEEGTTATEPLTVTAAAGNVTANTPATISFSLSSSDLNYSGLVVPSLTAYLFSTDPSIKITKMAYLNVGNPSTPATIESTGTMAPRDSRIMDGQMVCFVYTVVNTSADDWATTLSNVVVTDSDATLGNDGVIGTIPVIPIGQSAKLSACTALTPGDTTVGAGG